tara:strand:+ start:28 stop:1146 length:1119 start_codon:yes stop_codon:yes gene_type:complete
MEAIEQTWNGSSTTDGRCTATISRNGDLVHKMFIEVEGTVGADVDTPKKHIINPGSCIIKSVELEIGGQRIDKHSGVCLEALAELTQKNPGGIVGSKAAPLSAVPTGTVFQNMSGMGGYICQKDALERLYVPLQFWFCKNAGLALPLIALQYHEVKVILDHQISTVFSAGGRSNKLWVDYIYLDTDERRRFAQVSHEYLIEQVQEQAIEADSNNVTLNFNHPVKELFWTGTKAADADVPAGSKTSLQPATGTATNGTFQLKLNGHDRFEARHYRYFSRVQIIDYHTGSGGLSCDNDVSGTARNASSLNDAICVYSFALKPEEHQPSGTCNFSRIDTAQLLSSESFETGSYLFAINYNVLRIMSGMGGLAYSN